MSKYKQIFIVGHNAAGKGVLAQALAKKLDWQYKDADFGLAPSIGEPLINILGSEGNNKFQNKLSEILNFQLTQDNIVVTTDEALVCSKENRDLLKSAFTVNLKVSLDVQLERIGNNRPLLPNNDFKGFLNTLHQERDEYYNEVSSFDISSDNGEVEQIVESVLNEFRS